MLFQPDQSFLLIAHQHTFAWCKIYGSGEFFFSDYSQVIQLGFTLYVFIVRTVCYDVVIMVGKDGKTVLAGFLFQIRQHFRIDAAFKQYFSVLRLYYLATIVGEYESSIIT